MITKEDYLILFEKQLANQCNTEELGLLEEYQDEINLWDPELTKDFANRSQVRKRLLNKLSNSRGISHQTRLFQITWMRTAAATILLLSAIGVSIWYTNYRSLLDQKDYKSAGLEKSIVKPGGDKATLTMANGVTIDLNDISNGQIATQSGIRISKTNHGMLVYNFSGNQSKNGKIDTSKNMIRTPKGGQYQMTLTDGTKIWLNSASTLSFPMCFARNQRKVTLTGEAYFEVSKDKKRPFMVSANGNEVQVLGTHFNINAYPDNTEVATTLLEGSVRMKKGKSSTLLVPGEQAVSQNNAASLTIKNVNVNDMIGWKNGYFIFRDENIVNIMKQLSRWYDLEVIYTSEEIKDREFGGTVSRADHIKELLDYMELTQTIHYKLEGRRLFIMK